MSSDQLTIVEVINCVLETFPEGRPRVIEIEKDCSLLFEVYGLTFRVSVPHYYMERIEGDIATSDRFVDFCKAALKPRLIAAYVTKTQSQKA